MFFKFVFFKFIFRRSLHFPAVSSPVISVYSLKRDEAAALMFTTKRYDIRTITNAKIKLLYNYLRAKGFLFRGIGKLDVFRKSKVFESCTIMADEWPLWKCG